MDWMYLVYFFLGLLIFSAPGAWEKENGMKNTLH